MKFLVAFYSRTATTKKVAQAIAKSLKCGIEEIHDTKNRHGILGWLSAGMDATLKRLTVIQKPKKNITKYDLVIVGTPIWSWNVSPPVRTFLHGYGTGIRKAAFFCTMGGSRAEKAFTTMQGLTGKKPVSVLALTTKEVVSNTHAAKLKKFIADITQGKI